MSPHEPAHGSHTVDMAVVNADSSDVDAGTDGFAAGVSDVGTGGGPIDVLADPRLCEPPFFPLPAEAQIPVGEVDWWAQRFDFTDFPTHCIVVEDLDLDGHLDLLWGEIVSGHAALRVHFGPIHTATVQSQGIVIDLLDFGAADSCSVFDIDQDRDLDVVIASADGELGKLITTGFRSWDWQPKAGEFPDDLSGTRLLVTLPIDLDGRPPLELLVGGSPEVLLPCTGLATDPGGGRDVQIFSDIPENGWLRCMAVTDDGKFRVTPPGICPEFEAGLWLGAAKGDVNGDGLVDLVAVRDFGFNQMFTFAPSGGLRPASGDPFRTLYNHGMGVHIADVTQDGVLDTLITDLGPDQLYVGQRCLPPIELGDSTGLGMATDRTISWGVTSGDFDRDGDVDLLTGVSIRLPDGGFLPEKLCHPDLWGVPQANLWSVQWSPGRFKPFWLDQDPAFAPSFWGVSTIVADLDNDGDLDGLISTEDSVRVLWNEIPASGGWLGVVVGGEDGLPVADADVVVTNPGRLGARRFVTHTTGYAGHSPLRVHIGLGQTKGPWRVSIVAPGYITKSVDNITSNSTVKIGLLPEKSR